MTATTETPNLASPATRSSCFHRWDRHCSCSKCRRRSERAVGPSTPPRAPEVMLHHFHDVTRRPDRRSAPWVPRSSTLPRRHQSGWRRIAGSWRYGSSTAGFTNRTFVRRSDDPDTRTVHAPRCPSTRWHVPSASLSESRPVPLTAQPSPSSSLAPFTALSMSP